MDQQNRLAQAFAQMDIAKNGPATGSSGPNGGQPAEGAVGGYGSQAASGRGDGANRDMFAKVFPMLQGYMNDQTALACREVCRDWKSAVDVALSSPNSAPSNANNGNPNQ